MKTLLPMQQQLKVFSLIILFWMTSGVLLAQNPLVKQWDYRFGGSNHETLSSVKQTKDGGFILGGYSNSDISGDKSQAGWGIWDDYWVVKIDSVGNKQWDKRFGGTNLDWLFSMDLTTDGGYILGGGSNSVISGDKSQSNLGMFDFWIVKIDSIGNKIWDKRFGGTKDERIFSIQQTTDGGYIMGGWSGSGISGDKTQPNWDTTNMTLDYWVIKTDSIGNKVWDKRFGGTDNDFLYALQQTTDGGYILGGYSISDSSGDKSQARWGNWDDYWVVKIDSAGNKQWDRRFGGTSMDFLFSLQQTIDGGFILGGTSMSDIGGDKTQSSCNGIGGQDFWIVKIDSNGSKQWDKDLGANLWESQFGNITITNDGGYLLPGTSESLISCDKTEANLGPEQTWVVKTDALGNKIWDKTLHTVIFGADIKGLAIQCNDGCYLMANYTVGGIGGDKTQPTWGSHDFWVIKFCDTTQITTPAPTSIFNCTDTSFCEEHCIDFTDLSTNNPTSWQWFFPGADSSISSLQNPTNICYSTYGSFDVTLIACNAAGCDTLVLPGFINEYQTPTPTITQSNDTLFSSPGVAYQWWSVDSGIIAGANNSYYIPTLGGGYYVIVKDTNGCIGASNTIVITELTVMGINEDAIENSQITIVPNPNDGNFIVTINNSLSKDFFLHIINPIGQTIINRQKAKGQNVIDIQVSNLTPGLYVVEVINDDKVYRTRFIVE